MAYAVERLNKVVKINFVGSAKFQDDNCQNDDGRGLMLHTTITSTVSLFKLACGANYHNAI